MDKHDDTRQQQVVGVLALDSASRHDDVLARALSAWERLALHLSPLIGEAGFCALYGRAAALARRANPAVAENDEMCSVATLLQQLQISLATLDPASACTANAAVLETYTKLLCGLIGEGLTTRLLNTAWAKQPEENSNEH
jgi:hypothetical protein